jgi:hypothetical protein
MLLAKSRADELTIHIEEVSIGGASSSFYLDSSVSVIVLAVLTMVSGWATWWLDRRKLRQEVEGLKADNRQKDLKRRTSERRDQAGLGYPEREGGNAKRNLSKDYVTEWRTYIAEPLTFVDLCRDSAMSESELSPLRSQLHRLSAGGE